MGKRSSEWQQGPQTFKKRRKTVVHDPPTSEEVTSSKQLQSLLTFTHDLRQARHGLQSFKLFLDKLSAGEESQSDRKQLLHDFVTLTSPRIADADAADAVFLSDVMQTWSLAVEMHNEGVMSSVAVVLSLLLGVLSSSLDLVHYGLGICNTLLQERHQKLVAKNLSAEKNKAFIISPTLRLLREAVQLDGGAVARRIYRAREYLFASLGRNLEVKHIGNGPEDPTKSSIRTNAIRFLLACLKYLPPDARKELIQEKHIVSHLTFMLQTDPPYLIREICQCLRQYVLDEEKIPREVKFRVFSTKVLLRFLSLYTGLYGVQQSAKEPSSEPSVPDTVHQFLTFACTEPIAGILSPCKGLYPKKVADNNPSGPSALASAQKKSLGGSSSSSLDTFAEEVPVYNFALSDFAQKLRPWSSMKQSELLISIFSAAPELVSNYFVNNQSFPFEPKLTMTWMGYAAFLFSTIQLPLPEYFGAKSRYSHSPPPTSVLLDNILPRPINAKVLTRCFSPETPLPAFIAARLLILALEKLKTALAMLSQLDGLPWPKAGERLLNVFIERMPSLNDIMRSYKSTPPENILHRVTTSRLLLLCYEVIPTMALGANLDVSPFVLASLSRLGDSCGSSEEDGGERALLRMDLGNLISIASYSPSMRWFSRTEGMSMSPFGVILKLWIQGDDSASFPALKDVLNSLAIDYQLAIPTSGLDPLFRTFAILRQQSVQVPDTLWIFLDNCAGRCAGSSLKYLDMMDEVIEQQLPAGPAGPSINEMAVSLWLWTMAEQTPYAVKTNSYDELSALAGFFGIYLGLSHAANETPILIEALRKRIAVALPSDLGQSLLYDKAELSLSEANSSEVADKTQNTQQPSPAVPPPGSNQAPASREKHDLDEEGLKAMLHVPPLFANDTSALTKWTLKPVDDLIEEGYAASLVRLLLSEDMAIRKEALTNILKMADKIRQSSHKESEQTWLLLSELAESARDIVGEKPVPTCFSAFAMHAMDVLKNPLDPLYPKVNAYLTRRPTWSAGKLPLTHEILYHEPAVEDKYYTELSWLLGYLLDCLSTPSDLATFHHRRVFEEILLLYCNPFLKLSLRLKMLKILYRATCIEGGSNTLATRWGAFAWLEMRGRVAEDKAEKGACEALFLRLWATCDQERISEWSSEGIPLLIESGVWR